MNKKKYSVIKTDDNDPYETRMYRGISVGNKEISCYNEIVDLLNNLHEENIQLSDKNERLELINYQLSAKCHYYQMSLYKGRKYLRRLNEKFEKIFGISLENFLNIEYKR